MGKSIMQEVQMSNNQKEAKTHNKQRNTLKPQNTILHTPDWQLKLLDNPKHWVETE